MSEDCRDDSMVPVLGPTPSRAHALLPKGRASQGGRVLGLEGVLGPLRHILTASTGACGDKLCWGVVWGPFGPFSNLRVTAHLA